ncbi:mitogen-activated protein kinase [Acrasis kona]|uniref:Mitogen-activated protein kinase n=1 Tax=Acrasis kona TaxID=1008807 RepID=A0AAW2YZ87_9EUKA
MGKKLYTVNSAKFEVDERYSVIKPIGAAQDKLAGEKVAIKKVPKLFQDLVDGKRILREIKLLRAFKHENVISVKDIMQIPNKESFSDIYIVNELMDTDLHQVIRSKQQLTTEHKQYFVYQILRGLKYIHSAQVLHRDLKPSNILVNGNCDVKICDFGLARGFDPNAFQDLTEYVVTRWYRAPELLLMCQEYSEAIDMWSVGCIMAELINRKPLFPGKNYIDQLNLITDALGVPTDEEMAHITHKDALRYLKQLPKKKPIPFKQLFPVATPQEVDLLSKMLVFSPEKRITSAEVLSHPYLSGLHDKTDEPVSTKKFEFEYDHKEITESELRRLLYEESLSFHPLTE